VLAKKNRFYSFFFFIKKTALCRPNRAQHCCCAPTATSAYASANRWRTASSAAAKKASISASSGADGDGDGWPAAPALLSGSRFNCTTPSPEGAVFALIYFEQNSEGKKVVNI